MLYILTLLVLPWMSADKIQPVSLTQRRQALYQITFNTAVIRDDTARLKHLNVFLYKITGNLRIHGQQNNIDFFQVLRRADGINRTIRQCLFHRALRAVESNDSIIRIFLKGTGKGTANQSQADDCNFFLHMQNPSLSFEYRSIVARGKREVNAFVV